METSFLKAGSRANHIGPRTKRFQGFEMNRIIGTEPNRGQRTFRFPIERSWTTSNTLMLYQEYADTTNEFYWVQWPQLQMLHARCCILSFTNVHTSMVFTIQEILLAQITRYFKCVHIYLYYVSQKNKYTCIVAKHILTNQQY